MNELQDFKTKFLFVAPDNRKNKFNIEKTKFAFSNIIDRCNFQDYNYVESSYKSALNAKKFDIFQHYFN